MSGQLKYFIGFAAAFLFFVLYEILRLQSIREKREWNAWLVAARREQNRCPHD